MDWIFLSLVVIHSQLHLSHGHRLYKGRYSASTADQKLSTQPYPTVLIKSSAEGTAAARRPKKTTPRPLFEIPCRDLRKDCSKWAVAHGCVEDPIYMHAHCPASCQVCHQRWNFHATNESASYSIETLTADRIYDAVGRLLGIPQLIEDPEYPQNERVIRKRVQQADNYIEHVVNMDSRFLLVRGRCRNHDENCAYWAVEGGCDHDKDFMVETCAPLCSACEYLHVESKCPIDPSEMNALYRGDLNRMFKTIVSNEYYKKTYDVQVLSKPYEPESETQKESDTSDPVDGPWVVILDNFLNCSEAQTLIDIGAMIGYHRSTDVGNIEEDGSFGEIVSHTRTSTNAWCNTVDCLNHPVVVAVRERIENLTAIPMMNSEALQLLRYVSGQHYGLHHDYVSHEVSRRQGVRILTIFLYLNDVEEGGHTDFPHLRLSVAPKLGRALMWPSVLDEFPNKIDQRTEHRANIVMNGTKYGANAWLHQRALLDGC